MEQELEAISEGLYSANEGTKLSLEALELIAAVSTNEKAARKMVENNIPEIGAKIFI